MSLEVFVLGKTNFCVRIDEETLGKYKEFVLLKYGRLYDAIGLETESMIKNWLAAHTNITNTPAKLNPIGSRSERLAREITHWLLGKTETFQVHRTLIIRAIEELRGTDPRTIKTWFTYLRKHGHVKPLGGDMWEILK